MKSTSIQGWWSSKKCNIPRYELVGCLPQFTFWDSKLKGSKRYRIYAMEFPRFYISSQTSSILITWRFDSFKKKFLIAYTSYHFSLRLRLLQKSWFKINSLLRRDLFHKIAWKISISKKLQWKLYVTEVRFIKSTSNFKNWITILRQQRS